MRDNINENLPRRERERHATQFAKSSFEPYDREREIMNAFGPYRDDVPANVISYLRKNPRRFLQTLTDVYGMDRMLDFIGYEQTEIAEDYDDYMGSCNECGRNYMGENHRRKNRSHLTEENKRTYRRLMIERKLKALKR